MCTDPSPRRLALLTVQIAVVLFHAPLAHAAAAKIAPLPPSGQPAPAIVTLLHDYDPHRGDLVRLLQSVVPGLAQAVLQLGTTAVQRGGPMPQVLDTALLARLDGPPEALPLVLYKPEPGRLPGALVVARYKNVTPGQILVRLHLRPATMRHPLIAQYQALGLPRAATTAGWSDDAVHQSSRAFLALDLPAGAGLFGLRPSWAVLRQDTVRWPNGAALAVTEAVEPTPAEYSKLRTFRDRKKRAVHLDAEYHRALEYRVGHLLLPVRDASGVPRDTLHVYFVRIVPALDAGAELRAGSTLLRWVVDHAAPQVVVGPVALIRRAIGQ